MEKYEKITKKLLDFISFELSRNHFSKAIVGLSGGLDSAVVSVLAQKALGKNFTAITMPTANSSKIHLKDAQILCDKFSIKAENHPVGDLVERFFLNKPNASNLRKGNFTSRMRMASLYDISSQKNALVLGTSNKSEILLGYGTIYGDLACAINPIGDLYKSEIFELAAYLDIPEHIIKKAPSADLWEGQKDEDELGFSYEEIDKVLRALEDEKLDKTELLKLNINENLIDMVIKRIQNSRFKRHMPLIAKIK